MLLGNHEINFDIYHQQVGSEVEKREKDKKLIALRGEDILALKEFY